MPLSRSEAQPPDDLPLANNPETGQCAHSNSLACCDGGIISESSEYSTLISECFSFIQKYHVDIDRTGERPCAELCCETEQMSNCDNRATCADRCCSPSRPPAHCGDIHQLAKADPCAGSCCESEQISSSDKEAMCAGKCCSPAVMFETTSGTATGAAACADNCCRDVDVTPNAALLVDSGASGCCSSENGGAKKASNQCCSPAVIPAPVACADNCCNDDPIPVDSCKDGCCTSEIDNLEEKCNDRANAPGDDSCCSLGEKSVSEENGSGHRYSSCNKGTSDEFLDVSTTSHSSLYIQEGERGHAHPRIRIAVTVHRLYSAASMRSLVVACSKM